MDQAVVADKFRCDGRVDGLVNRHVSAHIVCRLSGFSGFLLLLLHAGKEAFLVYGKALFLQDLLREIKREAVGIVKLEGVRAGKRRKPVFLYVLFHVGKDGKTLVDGLVELVLLLGQHLGDHGLLFLQLRIAVFGEGDDRIGQICQEFSFDSKLSSVAGRTAQKTP